MNERGLMVGDWYYALNTEDKRVPFHFEPSDWIEGFDESCKAEPILLTEDMLEKNGLVKDMRYGYVRIDNKYGVYHSYDGEDGYSIISGTVDNRAYHLKLPKPIRYVHELQRVLRCVGLWDAANNFKVV